MKTQHLPYIRGEGYLHGGARVLAAGWIIEWTLLEPCTDAAMPEPSTGLPPVTGFRRPLGSRQGPRYSVPVPSVLVPGTLGTPRYPSVLGPGTPRYSSEPLGTPRYSGVLRGTLCQTLLVKVSVLRPDLAGAGPGPSSALRPSGGPFLPVAIFRQFDPWA